jgi:hypothetical protein
LKLQGGEREDRGNGRGKAKWERSEILRQKEKVKRQK